MGVTAAWNLFRVSTQVLATDYDARRADQEYRGSYPPRGRGRGSLDRGRHHLGTDPVRHLGAPQSVAVPHGGDAEADGLARFISPIGPVGGDANLHGTDIILCKQGQGKSGEQRESKHRADLTRYRGKGVPHMLCCLCAFAD